MWCLVPSCVLCPSLRSSQFIQCCGNLSGRSDFSSELYPFMIKYIHMYIRISLLLFSAYPHPPTLLYWSYLSNTHISMCIPTIYLGFFLLRFEMCCMSPCNYFKTLCRKTAISIVSIDNPTSCHRFQFMFEACFFVCTSQWIIC